MELLPNCSPPIFSTQTNSGTTRSSKSTKNSCLAARLAYLMADTEAEMVYPKVTHMSSWKLARFQRDNVSSNFGESCPKYDGDIANIYRNPWGKGKKGNWEGAWSDGSKELSPELQIELNHKSGSDSVFWISYQDLLRKYQHFDRTRLFMDCPDWRITQKWISVEVPWKAEFEQKYRIVLKKESPVVLVLSQLDDRFFEGLQGQYTFRLQFRLHEVDSLGENDYIVRSHGNYLMERSVVTELKSLPAGTYAVFVMVVADRDTHQPSVEDVVKAQCRRRVDNDKLAQVGMSYDIAHSKGASHSMSKDLAHKAQDKAKAREARIATRKKNWEKRHLSREIVRKQDKKNREKRERKEAKDAAAEKEVEDQESQDKSIQTEDTKEVTFAKDDKSVQTEDPPQTCPEPHMATLPANSDVQAMKDTDKGVQTEDTCGASVVDSQAPPDTPKSSIAFGSPPPLIRLPSMHRGPPPPPPPFSRDRKRASDRRDYITSEGESSASPISDFDDMYSDDDPTLKPRPVNATAAPGAKTRSNSDDEDETEPWNAVCIVGFRVYSKDEGLELLIWDESLDEMNRKNEKNKQAAIAKEDEGTDADVEDGGEESKEKEDEKPNEDNKENQDVEKAKAVDSIEVEIPIAAEDDEALLLVDEEREALALGNGNVFGDKAAEQKSEGIPGDEVKSTVVDAEQAVEE